MVNDFLPPRNRGTKPTGLNRSTTFNQQPVSTPPTPVTVQRPIISAPFNPKQKRTFKQRLQALSKKQWAIIGAVALMVIGGGTAAALTLTGDKEPVKKQTITKEAPVAQEPQSTTVPSTLTGLQVDPSVNERQVTAVMIENSMDARPQSGLNKAGVVFEAIAEGGITRFLTLFQDEAPDYVGPARSVRPYYVQWLMGFDAAVAHVGGSGDALALIRSAGAKDLDQFFNPAPYWRVSNRYAPHNMYTSIPKLNELEAKKGFTKSTYTGFARKDKETPSSTPNAQKIDFNISGAIYNAHYDYDATTNSYKRSEGGKPHTDERSGEQLAPKVVVGLVMPQGRNGIYTTYQTIGSGQAYVFQDGTVTIGSWQKDSNTSNFVFKDQSGTPLKLNPGQTWLTAVGGSDRITYAP